MLISSEYKVASDSVNKQIDELNTILKSMTKTECSSEKLPA